MRSFTAFLDHITGYAVISRALMLALACTAAHSRRHGAPWSPGGSNLNFSHSRQPSFPLRRRGLAPYGAGGPDTPGHRRGGPHGATGALRGALKPLP